MKNVKVVKVHYGYDSELEESVIRSVLEGIPWTEVTEEQFQRLSEAVRNKHKIPSLQNANLWIVEEVVNMPEAPYNVESLLQEYENATVAERRAAEKRKQQEAARKANKEAIDLAKKRKLLEKLQKELGEI